MAVKFQITVPEETLFRWKREANRRRVALAELVRGSVERELQSVSPQQRSSFLARITGLAQDCPDTDLAARVDEILYGPGAEGE